jgi:hypothetical protein
LKGHVNIGRSAHPVGVLLALIVILVDVGLSCTWLFPGNPSLAACSRQKQRRNRDTSYFVSSPSKQRLAGSRIEP